MGLAEWACWSGVLSPSLRRSLTPPLGDEARKRRHKRSILDPDVHNLPPRRRLIVLRPTPLWLSAGGAAAGTAAARRLRNCHVHIRVKTKEGLPAECDGSTNTARATQSDSVRTIGLVARAIVVQENLPAERQLTGTAREHRHVHELAECQQCGLFCPFCVTGSVDELQLAAIEQELEDGIDWGCIGCIGGISGIGGEFEPCPSSKTWCSLWER